MSKNAVFLGKFHDNKIGNFANFIVRDFVVIWEAPILVPVCFGTRLGASKKRAEPELILIAGMSAVKIASEWRCAILVHPGSKPTQTLGTLFALQAESHSPRDKAFD